MDSTSLTRPMFKLEFPVINDSQDHQYLVLNDDELLLSSSKGNSVMLLELINLADPIKNSRLVLTSGVYADWTLLPFTDGQKALIATHNSEGNVRLGVFNRSSNVSELVLSSKLDLEVDEYDGFPLQMIDPANFQLVWITPGEDSDQLTTLTGFPNCLVENVTMAGNGQSSDEEDEDLIQGSMEDIVGTFWTRQRIGKLEADHYDGDVNLLIWFFPGTTSIERVPIEPNINDEFPILDLDECKDFHTQLISETELFLSCSSIDTEEPPTLDLWRLDLADFDRPNWSKVAKILKPIGDDWDLCSFRWSSQAITLVYKNSVKIRVEQFALQPPTLVRFAQSVLLANHKIARDDDGNLKSLPKRRSTPISSVKRENKL